MSTNPEDPPYRLIDSVMQGSLFLFDNLKIGKEWLNKPVNTWSSYESFREMESFVKNLMVTNDTAERGIKLVTDYAKSLTKNPEERDALLQVVAQHRRDIPNANKTILAKALSSKK